MSKNKSLRVHIRRNDTGEIRIFIDEDILLKEDGLPETYTWRSGNYLCDCNRRLFFARVNDEDEDWDGECSFTQYSINIFFEGVLIYSEFEHNTDVSELCRLCFQSIKFVPDAGHWIHTKGNPRHPATPK